jgi:hypothetical protein
VNILRILSLGVLFAISSRSTQAKAPAPVAIVYSLTGEAWLTTSRQPLHLFDRLPTGTAVEVGRGSRLALAFLSGLRYELGERSRVTLGPRDLSSRSGLVLPLPQIPPLLRLAPIAEVDRPGRAAGAVRVRAERITGLYPRRGAATLAEETVLRFKPVEEGGRYRVEVQDEKGQAVFRVDVEAPAVRVPGRALLPGAQYHWTVRTLERAGPVARGEADFVTLPEDAAEAREELRAAIEAEGDGESLALLAEIDHSLGMLLEALQELQAAHDRSPGNAPLAQELAALEQRLKDVDEPHP